MLTPTHIHAAFVSLPDTGSGGHELLGPSSTAVGAVQSGGTALAVHLMEVACPGGGPAVTAVGSVVPGLSGVGTGAAGPLPPALPRPPGPLALLGPRDGYLWMVNAHGQVDRA